MRKHAVREVNVNNNKKANERVTTATTKSRTTIQHKSNLKNPCLEYCTELQQFVPSLISLFLRQLYNFGVFTLAK